MKRDRQKDDRAVVKERRDNQLCRRYDRDGDSRRDRPTTPSRRRNAATTTTKIAVRRKKGKKPVCTQNAHISEERLAALIAALKAPRSTQQK